MHFAISVGNKFSERATVAGRSRTAVGSRTEAFTSEKRGQEQKNTYATCYRFFYICLCVLFYFFGTMHV